MFFIQHTVGSSNSIQTLNITGTGAGLAFTTALLTVNVIETIAFGLITPASLTFTSAGASSVDFVASAFSNYYITPADITVSTVGMPAITNPVNLSKIQNGNNVDVELDITVPTTATAGTITITGTATLMYTLKWVLGNVPSPMLQATGIIGVPSGQIVNNSDPYYNSPFDANSTRLATITYTCLPTQVLTNNSFTDSGVGYPAGTTVSNVLNELPTDDYSCGILVINVQIPVLTTNTTATPTITTVGPVVASLGNPPTTLQLSQPGTSVNITNTSTVYMSVSIFPSTATWLKINGLNATAEVAPGVNFTISADANNTAANRTASVIINNLNTRIVPGLVSKTINITQLS